MGNHRHHRDTRRVGIHAVALDRRAAKEDQELQRKQLEILDGILTELAIQNSEDTIGTGLHPAGNEVRDESTSSKAKNRTEEHTVCN